MANQKQLDLLTQGIETWNQWKRDTHGVSPGLRSGLHYDADLSDADLSETDLNGADLGNVDLANANFAGTHLIEACLAEAELAEANFTGADLTRANLSGANICGADFSHANLSSADLSGADLSETCLLGTNLQGANLQGANLDKARLQETNLNQANLSGVYCRTYPNCVEIRRANKANAMTRRASANRQKIKRYAKSSYKEHTQGHDIVLYARTNRRLLRLGGGSLLFVTIGAIMLQNPENLTQMIAGIIAIIFFGLAFIIFLIQFLSQHFRHTPLLVIHDDGIQYFYPYRLGTIEQKGTTQRDITLTWKEIGVIGSIKIAQTDTFAVYASGKRWRSYWHPDIQLPQTLLPISVRQLITLIQEHYQIQIDTYHIEHVEAADTSSLPG